MSGPAEAMTSPGALAGTPTAPAHVDGGELQRPAGLLHHTRPSTAARGWPGPVDVVAGVAAPAAGEGELPGEAPGPARRPAGRPGSPAQIRWPSHHRPAQVKAVGVEQVLRPGQPVGPPPWPPPAPPPRRVVKSRRRGPWFTAPVDRSHSAAALPRWLSAPREERPSERRKPSTTTATGSVRVPAAARPDGAHHVQVALEDQAGALARPGAGRRPSGCPPPSRQGRGPAPAGMRQLSSQRPPRAGRGGGGGRGCGRCVRCPG